MTHLSIVSSVSYVLLIVEYPMSDTMTVLQIVPIRVPFGVVRNVVPQLASAQKAMGYVLELVLQNDIRTE